MAERIRVREVSRVPAFSDNRKERKNVQAVTSVFVGRRR